MNQGHDGEFTDVRGGGGDETMANLTRDEIVTALGSVDDTLVSDILGTGASSEEFAQARVWLANDEAPINAGEPLASGVVARLIGILECLEDGADDVPT
jgi:hypothetical protein